MRDLISLCKQEILCYIPAGRGDGGRAKSAPCSRGPRNAPPCISDRGSGVNRRPSGKSIALRESLQRASFAGNEQTALRRLSDLDTRNTLVKRRKSEPSVRLASERELPLCAGALANALHVQSTSNYRRLCYRFVRFYTWRSSTGGDQFSGKLHRSMLGRKQRPSSRNRAQ